MHLQICWSPATAPQFVRWMPQAIAAENNLAETAFFVPEESGMF
jgi:hypothetical protein